MYVIYKETSRICLIYNIVDNYLLGSKGRLRYILQYIATK